MEIVKRVKEETYSFTCPECSTKLRAKKEELKFASSIFDWYGRETIRFTCPVCKQEHLILFDSAAHDIVYED